MIPRLAPLAFALSLVTALAAEPAPAQPAGGGAENLAGSSVASLTEVPDRGSLTVRGAFRVPARARLPLAEGGRPVDLAATLRVHDAPGGRPLAVEHVARRDAAGAPVRDHPAAPTALRPFGAVGVSAPTGDARGGTGAGLVAGWAAAGPTAGPVVGALVLGGPGSRGYPSVPRGRPIAAAGGRR